MLPPSPAAAWQPEASVSGIYLSGARLAGGTPSRGDALTRAPPARTGTRRQRVSALTAAVPIASLCWAPFFPETPALLPHGEPVSPAVNCPVPLLRRTCPARARGGTRRRVPQAGSAEGSRCPRALIPATSCGQLRGAAVPLPSPRTVIWSRNAECERLGV